MGINACQVGYRPSEPLIEEMLRQHHAEGGRLKWIASFYSLPQEPEEVRKELDQLLHMTPRPIGVQQVGNTSDHLMRTGQIDLTLDNLKRFRDSGLLVGLGAHNHEVIDYAEGKGWDVDFYQCSFYRSVFSLRETGPRGELFEVEARESMTRTIRQVTNSGRIFAYASPLREPRSFYSPPVATGRKTRHPSASFASRRPAAD
jgi:hypothetical protein